MVPFYVDGIPATSKSGLAITRTLISYRSSLRLLQNVLHNHHGHKLAGQQNFLPSIIIYYNSAAGWAGAPVQHPHQAYVDHVIAYSTNNNPSTIGDVMGFTPNANPNQGDKVTGTLNTYSSDTVSYKATYLYPAHDSSQQLQPYITAFTINGQTIDINFTDICASHHDPFWFYSLNGNVLIQNGFGPEGYHKNPEAQTGDGFQLFADYPLAGHDVTSIVWQAIAPDQDYGFASCVGGN